MSIDLYQSDLNGRSKGTSSANGGAMTVQIIAAWAAQNGFAEISMSKYRRSTDGRTITIEIKKFSVVLIDERPGLRPRMISALFKDFSVVEADKKLGGFLFDHRRIAQRDTSARALSSCVQGV